MRALLLAFTVLLTACSGLSVRALYDDFKFDRDVARDTAIDAGRQAGAGYHVIQVRHEGQSPLLYNRLRKDGERAVFVNGYRQLLKFSHGRLVASSGFDTDVALIGEVPGPLAVAKPGRPVCWQASWRAHGQRTASYYPLQGCMTLVGEDTPSFLQGAKAWHVRETVTAFKQQVSYQNDWWLDASRQRVLAGRQQPGPLLPAVFWTALNEDGPSRFNLTALYMAAPKRPAVAVAVEGLVSQQLIMPARLINLTTPYVMHDDIDWVASQLFDTSPSALKDLAAARSETIAALQALQQRPGLSVSERLDVARVIRGLEGLRQGRRIFVSLDPLRLHVLPEDNLHLLGSHYTLVLKPYQAGIPVRGMVHDHQVFPAFGRFQQAPLPRNAWQGLAAPRQAMLTLHDGQTLTTDLDDPNDPIWRELPPGSQLFVPLATALERQAGLPLNARLRDLYLNSLP